MDDQMKKHLNEEMDDEQIREMKAEFMKQEMKIEQLKMKGEKSDKAQSLQFKELKGENDDLAKMQEELRSTRSMEVEKSVGEEAFTNQTQKRKGEEEVTSPGKKVCGDANEENVEIHHEKTNDEKSSSEENFKKFNDNIEKNELNIPEIITPELQMNVSNLEHFNHHFQPSLRWTIVGIGKKTEEEDSFEMLSPEFDWIGYPVLAQAKLKFKKDGPVNVHLDLASFGKNYENDIKVVPDVFYLLRFQKMNAFPIFHQTNRGYLFDGKLNLLSLNFADELCKTSVFSNSGKYNVNDSAVLEVYVELPSDIQKALSYDGTLSGEIRNLAASSADTKFAQDTIYLYTAPKGYKVQFYFENGVDDVFRGVIQFVTGEFDRELPKCLDFQTSITLFHRQNQQKNITKSLDRHMNTKSDLCCELDMCFWSDVDEFLRDGKLHFKLAIEAI